MNNSFFVYLAIMVGTTYLIRVIPFVAVQKKITNTFIRSFLHYIPYTVLACMTFPTALYATGNIVASAFGLVVAIIFAIKGKDLTTVAVLSCLTVLVVEIVMTYLI